MRLRNNSRWVQPPVQPPVQRDVQPPVQPPSNPPSTWVRHTPLIPLGVAPALAAVHATPKEAPEQTLSAAVIAAAERGRASIAKARRARRLLRRRGLQLHKRRGWYTVADMGMVPPGAPCNADIDDVLAWVEARP